MSNGTFIQNLATTVDANKKTVTLANGQALGYDALIIATGSRNFSPAEPPASVTDRKGTLAYLNSTREQLCQGEIHRDCGYWGGWIRTSRGNS